MNRRKRLYAAFCLLLTAVSPKLANARPQLPDPLLTRLDEAHLDSLAAHTAQKIREAKLVENEHSVLVIFFEMYQGATHDWARYSLTASPKLLRAMPRE